jgi:hypothetical protein
MLSVESQFSSEVYAFKNGMRNLLWITGYVGDLTSRGGRLYTSGNGNQAIPFELSSTDTMPRRLRNGSVTKIVGRIEGRRDAVTGEPTAIVRVLSFQVPRVLDMPPESAWERSLPKGAPATPFTPSAGQSGLGLRNTSNVVDVAGIVAGRRLRKPGAVREDGTQSTGCLYLLLQQTAEPSEAIPVRIYGRFSGQEERAIKIGTCVRAKASALRIDAKRTGKVLDSGLEEVNAYLYVRSPGLYVATREDIQAIPTWAKQLVEEHARDRAAKRSLSESGSDEDSDTSQGAVSRNTDASGTGAEPVGETAAGAALAADDVFQILGAKPA